MMTLDAFTRQSAKEYLHSIVFVDDEIYDTAGRPAETSAIVPRFKSPFANDEPQSAVEAPRSVEKPPYHPKHLLESFAQEGMVCALYEPKENFGTDRESELFKLCARADVVIFDWDLYKMDGRNLLPLIANLVSESQNSVPHHVRLCAIYTTKPNLESVANSIYEHLNAASLMSDAPEHALILTAGATRIIVLGKPGVVGRGSDLRSAEVQEEDLATRIIDEFSKMHRGILPAYALHGMAKVRLNSKRILDKFHRDMDGAFLVHRASLMEHEDAFDQLPELLAEEALAVLIDEQVRPEVSVSIAEREADAFVLKGLDWPPVQGASPEDKNTMARLYLGRGASSIGDRFKVKSKQAFEAFHRAMGCAETHAEQRLAALFNLRTRYFRAKRPELGFGVVVRLANGAAGSDAEYSICLMPVCDSIRLEPGEGVFPFWRLKLMGSGVNGRGIVVETKDGEYVNLVARGRPREMLWLEEFEPDAFGTVVPQEEDSSFWFSGKSRKLEWVAQLKPAHAQRVAHDIGQSFSRVGVFESEWLRLLTGG